LRFLFVGTTHCRETDSLGFFCVDIRSGLASQALCLVSCGSYVDTILIRVKVAKFCTNCSLVKVGGAIHTRIAWKRASWVAHAQCAYKRERTYKECQKSH